ncbi:sodium/bile acid cotransporter 4 [Pseudoliparis swirei]|uniref:sodium/bile acid cotransporter 4 n=1 Tax=Pseudoliparis swirei TaxID=2059687 RepID=UPI0024BD7B2F|nr:sodium/bile acid cotransporter 4 [Pseudoliparis swirei]
MENSSLSGFTDLMSGTVQRAVDYFPRGPVAVFREGSALGTGAELMAAPLWSSSSRGARVVMTISSTLLALVLMPLCLWIYSRAWINTPVVDLMPFGAIILTLGSTLIPIGLGVVLRYRSARVADLVLKVSLWSLLVTLVLLFVLTGVMLGPELLATIPPSVYAVAVLMPLCGYGAGYGLAALFELPPSSRRSVSLETGCQNVQLCTAILKLAFPPQLMGAMYMFPLLYALFQAVEAGAFILAYRMYGQPDPPRGGGGEDSGITYQRFQDDGEPDSFLGVATASVTLEPCPSHPTPV